MPNARCNLRGSSGSEEQLKPLDSHQDCSEALRWLVSFIVVFNSLLVGIEAQWGIENLNQAPAALGLDGVELGTGWRGEVLDGGLEMDRGQPLQKPAQCRWRGQPTAVDVGQTTQGMP